jgi:hypothetical protein
MYEATADLLLECVRAKEHLHVDAADKAASFALVILSAIAWEARRGVRPRP